jgi:hypothetical protein
MSEESLRFTCGAMRPKTSIVQWSVACQDALIACAKSVVSKDLRAYFTVSRRLTGRRDPIPGCSPELSFGVSRLY